MDIKKKKKKEKFLVVEIYPEKASAQNMICILPQAGNIC